MACHPGGYIGFEALFFCKILARWVYKKHTHLMRDDMAMRGYIGFEALFFCKIVARWVYLNTPAVAAAMT